MNITFFIGSLTGGGAERVCCQLASYLVEKGHVVKILTVTDTANKYDLDDRVENYTLDTKLPKRMSLLRLPIKMLKLPLFLLKNKTDVYVVFLAGAIRAISFYRNLVKSPVIISNRNDPSLYSDKLRRQLFQASKHVNAIVCQTEAIRSYYEMNVPGKSYYVIPNSISPKFEKYDGPRKKIIVSAGRFMDQKNFPLLINAFARISSKYPEYKLVIYGEGPEREQYNKMLKKLKIQNKVEFPGYVNDVTDKIKTASVFVLSSKYEGIPNALMEAMAVGLPCISTDCRGDGAKFLINNMENGILVPNEDLDAMVKAIEFLLDNPEIAQSFGEKASHIHEQLSPDIIYKRWEEMILSVAHSY